MPFAGHSGEIARGLQHLGDRDRAVGDPSLESAETGADDIVESAHPRFMRIKPRQQRGARRAATGRVVELREAEAVRGQRVEIGRRDFARSEEHTSELQSLMRISYAVFCLQKKNNKKTHLKQDRQA